MALTGVHVACGPINVVNGASLVGTLDWSETLAAAGTTTNSAPGQSSRMFEVSAGTDVFFAIGPNPNATTGPRFLLKGDGYPRTVLVQSGDKLAWIAA